MGQDALLFSAAFCRTFQDTRQPNPGDLQMSETNKEILRKANQAISQGDFEGFLLHCSEDTEWNFIGEQTIRGKDAVRQWMIETYKEPPRFRVDRMIADADFVAALGEIMIRNESGEDQRHAYCDVWRFEGGRMVELRAFVVATT